MRETSLGLALPAFARALKLDELAQAYAASHGFCLPHLQQILDHVEDPAALELLLTLTHARLQAIDAELAEYIRKNDHRFNHEPWGSERDAWKRVIPLMGGDNLKEK
jgi:DNA-binding transcriptional MerR regulator